MIKKITLLVFFFFLSFFSKAQLLQLSEVAEISIITADSGNELYEAFGHSAIRIKDNANNLDRVYNYGMFDFNAPNFYSNFVKGKLLYKLGKYDFAYFLYSYQKDKRWVKEQILNLTQKEKQEFYNLLEENAKPKNASYLYDPFFNNCATKLRDITKTILKDKIRFEYPANDKLYSLRELMNKELHWNTWGNLGINIALGNKLDKKLNHSYYMYLPDYVYQFFDNATLLVDDKELPLKKKSKILLNFKNYTSTSDTINPFLVFFIVMLFGLFITYKDLKRKERTKWLDFILFFFTGLVGIVIIFLWFFTNHSTTPNNFNFLWAFAPNIILAFIILKDKYNAWSIFYLKSLIALLLLIPLVWVFKIQLFSLVLLPLLILLLTRYYFLSTKLLTPIK